MKPLKRILITSQKYFTLTLKSIVLVVFKEYNGITYQIQNTYNDKIILIYCRIQFFNKCNKKLFNSFSFI